MKAACGSEKNMLAFPPEHAEPDGEGGVTVAPDSRRCISIATGSSPGLPRCLSPLCLSVWVCPLGQQVEAYTPGLGTRRWS
ncbi:hypothetical protein VZT92_010635 [Zoarces viviparus]|uniref:Uncharacterized protein n=1 Tax=Zoarces viviparus TaxID=48416 RepID=A0AAW1F8W1_ZOAVI